MKARPRLILRNFSRIVSLTRAAPASEAAVLDTPLSSAAKNAAGIKSVMTLSAKLIPYWDRLQYIPDCEQCMVELSLVPM